MQSKVKIQFLRVKKWKILRNLFLIFADLSEIRKNKFRKKKFRKQFLL